MRIRDASIKARLTLAFGIVVLLVLALGITSLLRLRTLANLTSHMYHHPLAVSISVREIQGGVVAIHRSMKDVVLSTGPEEVAASARSVEREEQRVLDHFDLVSERFLGDKGDVEKCREIFLSWKSIRDEVFLLMRDGDREGAAAITRGKGARHVARINEKVETLALFASRKADTFYSDAQTTFRRTTWLLGSLFFAILLACILVAALISRGITRSMGTIFRRIRGVAGGDLAPRVEIGSDNEFGRIEGAINSMAGDLQERTTSIDRLNREIRERENTERNLRESEEKFRALTEHSYDITMIIGQDHLVRYCSPSVERVCGIPVEKLSGTHIGESIHPDDIERIFDAIDRAAGNPQETIHVRDFRVRHRNGSWVHLDTSLLGRIGVPGIDGVVANSRDITDQKIAEEGLRQSQKMEAVGTFAGGIAHDFNNILYAILGNAELAMEDLEEGSGGHTHLSQIVLATRRGAALIKQLLTFSKQRGGALVSTDLLPVIEETIALLRGVLPTSVRIVCQLDPDCGPVLANADQVQQVVMNLCTNAFQALPGHRGTIELSMNSVVVDKALAKSDPGLHPGRFIKLTVSDTGAGMDPSTVRRVFEPFFTTKALTGTGLGLSTAHGIVKRHSGVITVQSAPGRGTTMSVFLPVLPKEARPLSPETVVPLETSCVADGTRVLFVDDEEIITAMSAASLGRLGFHVTTSNDSGAALETFRINPDRFDVIVTDQTMPNLSGMEFARGVLEIRPDMPIVLCTGFSEEIDEGAAKAGGVREFLMKPIDARRLAVTILRAADARAGRAVPARCGARSGPVPAGGRPGPPPCPRP